MRIPGIRADAVCWTDVTAATARVGTGTAFTDSVLDGCAEPLMPLVTQSDIFDASYETDEWVFVIV